MLWCWFSTTEPVKWFLKCLQCLILHFLWYAYCKPVPLEFTGRVHIDFNVTVFSSRRFDRAIVNHSMLEEILVYFLNYFLLPKNSQLDTSWSHKISLTASFHSQINVDISPCLAGVFLLTWMSSWEVVYFPTNSLYAFSNL